MADRTTTTIVQKAEKPIEENGRFMNPPILSKKTRIVMDFATCVSLHPARTHIVKEKLFCVMYPEILTSPQIEENS
jgi:hypothetical protein